MSTQATDLYPITIDEARELASWRSTPTISVFLPTKRAIVEPEENSLELKGLLPKIQQQLEERNHKRGEVNDLLAPLVRLLQDRSFWLHQLEGLALFRTADELRRYVVPVSLPSSVFVGDNPVIRPLLKALSGGTEFHVLALSQNAIRLLHCTRHGAEEVDLSGLDIPLSFDEAMRFDDFEKPAMQHRPMAASPRPSRNTSQGADFGFHGHGAEEDHKRQILRYFQAVDPGISKLLEARGTPLILAGVEYLHPIYRQASDHPRILERTIDGNADGLRVQEIHEQAVPIFEAEVAGDRDELAERYGDLGAHGRASADLADILDAGGSGRIDKLFVTEGAEAWGVFDPANRQLQLDAPDGRSEASVDLYDLAARQTLLGSGGVEVLPPEEIPGGGSIAAIFRY